MVFHRAGPAGARRSPVPRGSSVRLETCANRATRGGRFGRWPNGRGGGRRQLLDRPQPPGTIDPPLLVPAHERSEQRRGQLQRHQPAQHHAGPKNQQIFIHQLPDLTPRLRDDDQQSRLIFPGPVDVVQGNISSGTRGAPPFPRAKRNSPHSFGQKWFRPKPVPTEIGAHDRC